MTQYGKVELSTLAFRLSRRQAYTLNLGIRASIYSNQPVNSTAQHRPYDGHEQFSHILTSRGLSENIDPVITTNDEIGDTAVLCSDGVYNLFSQSDFCDLIKKIGGKNRPSCGT